MKKIVLFILSVLMITSCATTQNPTYSVRDTKPKKVYVKDYSEQMHLLKINFPEIYKLLCDGKVILEKMYKYYDKNGTEKVHVSYRHVTPSNYYYKW